MNQIRYTDPRRIFVIELDLASMQFCDHQNVPVLKSSSCNSGNKLNHFTTLTVPFASATHDRYKFSSLNPEKGKRVMAG